MNLGFLLLLLVQMVQLGLLVQECHLVPSHLLILRGLENPAIRGFHLVLYHLLVLVIQLILFHLSVL